ncbi:dTDP-4-dehydrorhamnose 3,5-epimerase [Palleronia caenipelagi]|uniref:dTDP-4-dehydrorhamnose 3,5-epimerase n=1 Tax=Palleronia caenipelagi TaxID=2489174 RepID=A0A547Q7P6_9RHOB|nr:dTDP-4-dehydrorhamnose 3,5-epimerase [Palleronia caenipelagi]TRD22415.1 dTDP-4-dehydrorhamnose 3,5-epimerase [Palleronia caenipelagi]
MQVDETGIPGLLLLTPKRFGDSRGWFSEVYNQATLQAATGLETVFVQDNHSLSRVRGTLRGLHCQRPPYAQAKLVRCGGGAVWDIAVDIRHGSPTFGQWRGYELSAENGNQLYIPTGFLHGFITLTPDAELLYKCSAPYSAECDVSIRFDDPAFGVDWGDEVDLSLLSNKDREAPTLSEFENPFTYEAE